MHACAWGAGSAPFAREVLAAGEVEGVQVAQEGQGRQGTVAQSVAVAHVEVRQAQQRPQARQALPLRVAHVAAALQVEVCQPCQACVAPAQ